MPALGHALCPCHPGPTSDLNSSGAIMILAPTFHSGFAFFLSFFCLAGISMCRQNRGEAHASVGRLVARNSTDTFSVVHYVIPPWMFVN